MCIFKFFSFFSSKKVETDPQKVEAQSQQKNRKKPSFLFPETFKKYEEFLREAAEINDAAKKKRRDELLKKKREKEERLRLAKEVLAKAHEGLNNEMPALAELARRRHEKLEKEIRLLEKEIRELDEKLLALPEEDEIPDIFSWAEKKARKEELWEIVRNGERLTSWESVTVWKEYPPTGSVKKADIFFYRERYFLVNQKVITNINPTGKTRENKKMPADIYKAAGLIEYQESEYLIEYLEPVAMLWGTDSPEQMSMDQLELIEEHQQQLVSS